MDEIGRAVRRMEELDACKDKLALFWDLGRVMILEEQLLNWEEQGRDWRS